MASMVHAADVQDRDGGVPLMEGLSRRYPKLRKVYADGGYQGPKFRHGLKRACRRVKAEIVRRCDRGAHGAAEALGGGVDDRVVEPVPPVGEGPGMSRPEWTRVPAMGVGAADVEKSMSGLVMILDRL